MIGPAGVRGCADRLEWIVEAGSIGWPFYLAVDGGWSPTLGPHTARFVDRHTAEAAQPDSVKSWAARRTD